VRPDVSSARGHCRAGYGIARRACDREGGRGWHRHGVRV